MTQSFTSKKARKQAEDEIIRDMRKVLARLDEYKKTKEIPVDKANIMSVLTKFAALKRDEGTMN